MLEPLSVTGTLGIVPAGLYGSLEIGGGGPEGKILDAGVFSISGRFLLQINTTSATQKVRGRDPVTGTFFDAQGKRLRAAARAA